MHEVDRAGGEPGLMQDVDEHVGADRGDLRRLPDERAAKREAVDDRNAGDVDGEVPRRDRSHDADRLLHHHDALAAVELLRRGQHLAAVTDDVLRRAAEVVDGELHHLLLGLADRLARLAGDHLGDRGRALEADLKSVAADLDALHQRRLAPRREGVGRGLNRSLELIARRGVDGTDEAVVVRVADLELRALAVLPCAIDECARIRRHVHPLPGDRDGESLVENLHSAKESRESARVAAQTKTGPRSRPKPTPRARHGELD